MLSALFLLALAAGTCCCHCFTASLLHWYIIASLLLYSAWFASKSDFYCVLVALTDCDWSLLRDCLYGLCCIFGDLRAAVGL